MCLGQEAGSAPDLHGGGGPYNPPPKKCRVSGRKGPASFSRTWRRNNPGVLAPPTPPALIWDKGKEPSCPASTPTPNLGREPGRAPSFPCLPLAPDLPSPQRNVEGTATPHSSHLPPQPPSTPPQVAPQPSSHLPQSPAGPLPFSPSIPYPHIPSTPLLPPQVPLTAIIPSPFSSLPPSLPRWVLSSPASPSPISSFLTPADTPLP